eukprot:g9216.t1
MPWLRKFGDELPGLLLDSEACSFDSLKAEKSVDMRRTRWLSEEWQPMFQQRKQEVQAQRLDAEERRDYREWRSEVQEERLRRRRLIAREEAQEKELLEWKTLELLGRDVLREEELKKKAAVEAAFQKSSVQRRQLEEQGILPSRVLQEAKEQVGPKQAEQELWDALMAKNRWARTQQMGSTHPTSREVLGLQTGRLHTNSMALRWGKSGFEGLCAGPFAPSVAARRRQRGGHNPCRCARRAESHGDWDALPWEATEGDQLEEPEDATPGGGAMPSLVVVSAPAAATTAESSLVERFQALEGKVVSLSQSVEALAESLDFHEEHPISFDPTISPTDPSAAPHDGATAVEHADAATSPMAGSKEVPASRPTSRSEGLKSQGLSIPDPPESSSLDALTGRVSALEVMMGAERRLMPATNVQTSVPSDEVPSAPSMPSADAQVAAPSDQVPSAPAMPSADVQVPAPADQVPSAPAMPSHDLEEKLSFLEFHSRSPEQSSILNEISQDVRLCLKRCELILQLPEIKAFIKKFQSSLQVNAVLHDSWLGPTKSRLFEDEEAPKIEPCKSTGDLTSVAADPFHARPAVKRGEFNKRPFRTVNDWARPHTPLTLDPRGKAPPSLPEIPR